jgi:hypothetical protein
VAMVGDEIRQTRCTTCDAEHPYKRGKVPPRRKKADSVSGAYEEVLAAVKPKDGDTVLPNPREASPQPKNEWTPPVTADRAAASNGDGHTAGAGNEDENPALAAQPPADGPVHRPLIRATLPRTDNPQAARPVPEFTIRQTARPGKFHGRPPGARFPKGRPPMGQGGSPRSAGPSGPGRPPRDDGRGQRGPGFPARTRQPQGSGMRSSFRPHKKRSR